MVSEQDKCEYVRRVAQALVLDAERMGVVVTIENAPLTPLAMGNHFMQVSVRPARPFVEPLIRGEWE